MNDRLTHVDEHGAARMVDVSEKAVTARWLDPSHGGINLGFPQNH